MLPLPIDSCIALTPNFRLMLSRNLDEGAKFVLVEDRINRVEPLEEEETGEAEWFPLTADGINQLMRLPHGFILVQATESHVLCAPIVESSYLSMGFAVTNARRSRKKRRGAIRESVDGIKELLRTNRPMLRHFLTLSDAYRSDQQLSSQEAKTAMEVLLKGIYDTNPEISLAWGNVSFEPNRLAWISFLDSIGQQSLGEFLGISSIEDIPGGDVEQRADAIRANAGADAPPVEPEPPPPLVSSAQRAALLQERQRRAMRAMNPRLANFFDRR